MVSGFIINIERTEIYTILLFYTAASTVVSASQFRAMI